MTFLLLLFAVQASESVQFKEFHWDLNKGEALKILVSDPSFTEVKVKKKKIEALFKPGELQYFVTFYLGKNDSLHKITLIDMTEGETWKQEQVRARFTALIADMEAKGWSPKELKPPHEMTEQLVRASDGNGWVDMALETIPLTIKLRINITYKKGRASSGLF